MVRRQEGSPRSMCFLVGRDSLAPPLPVSLCPAPTACPAPVSSCHIPTAHPAQLVSQAHCHSSQALSPNIPDFIRLTALCSPCLNFLCSQFLPSYVWLFSHLSSAFFSHQFLYWAQLVYILSGICPNHNPASSFSK